MDEALEERISSRWQPMVRLEEMVTPRTRIEVTLIAPWRMGAGSTEAPRPRRRDIMLQLVYDIIPEIYEFTHQAYWADSQLQFGPLVVRSQMGPQQGDPLGPLLFCLPLQPVLRSMRSGFRIGYLDNLSLGGK